MKILSEIKFILALFLVLSVTLFGCFDSQDESEVNEKIYVTVNGAYLTESGLRAITPKEFFDNLTLEHKRKIVEEWVNIELLYQEALATGIENDPEIKRLLLNSRQNLLSNEFLERELSDIEAPNAAELELYYTQNKEYFEIVSNEFLVRYALFDNKDDADAFHKRVKANESFSDLASKLSKHPSSKSGGNLGIVNEDSVEPNIWEMINNIYEKLGTRKISDPFIVIDGWGCVIVDEIYEPGTIKPLESVKDLLIDMYMSEKREETKDTLIKGLKDKAEIKYENLR
ncbi:peptidyl-prolyl cis-trans isomerase [Candidatus Latescibacterota bacterium]